MGSIALCIPLLAAAVASPPRIQECVGCHQEATPAVVRDWKLSKHSSNGVNCAVCHGDGHHTAEDVDQAEIPTPDTCAPCHAVQVSQYSKGKHAAAWTAMQEMPTIHMQPMAMIEGMEGCGGCHKIGLKSKEEIRRLREKGRGYGIASCDACHTRHTFSPAEAREPQACRTCHAGFDHAQWEMYDGSKHGVRHALKREGVLSESASAPTCQSCHMPGGDHEVRTAWGYLGVRLPLPPDLEWAADQTVILQGLGILDPAGNPTPRLEQVRAADTARLDEEGWTRERAKMLAACTTCHATPFAQEQLAHGDEMLREADRLMAQAIRTVAGLYADRTLDPPAGRASRFPDLLTLHDASTPIEERLFVMFFEHRMRTFQGTFHDNPEYALWHGWSAMRRDLVEIHAMAEELRERKARR